TYSRAVKSIGQISRFRRLKRTLQPDQRDGYSIEAAQLLQAFFSSGRSDDHIDTFAEDMQYLDKDDHQWLYDQIHAEWMATGCEACRELLFSLAVLCGYAHPDAPDFHDDEDGMFGGGND
ncbi:MAG: hypothetical protein KDB27_25935, partial [Planctomycetales bacterium]|nr:hypothetical protein [Planctomycetales bacterium]